MLYSFEAKGDYAPTFVSENIKRLFGYEPREYLEGPDFWLDRVHPDDLPRVRPSSRACSSSAATPTSTGSAARTARTAGSATSCA